MNNLNGLSTHSIKPMILPRVLSSFLDSGFGAEVGVATDTLIVCSALGLGVRRLTGATFAGGFFAVTIMRIYPVYDFGISPYEDALELLF